MKSNISEFHSSSPAYSRTAMLFLTLLIAGLVGVLTFVHLDRNSSASYATAATSHASVYVGSGDGALYKLDGASGALHWRFQTLGRSIPGPAAVANGVIYFGSSDTNVYALNTHGSQLWKFQTGGSVLTSPVVVGGVVYVGSADGNIYALDAKSGTKLWSTFTGNANEAVTPSTAVVDQGIVYASSSDNFSHSYLFALDAKTGKQLWRTQVDNQIFTSPQVANGLIYIASFAMSRQGGPTVTDSFVYAFNATDGSQHWRSAKVSDSIMAAPTVSNGFVYFGSRNTNVYALNADNGTERWQHSVGGAVDASPQVVNGVVYVGETGGASTSNAILALNATDGSQIWQHPLTNYAGSNLAVNNTALYVGSSDSMVFALKTSDGSQIWSHQDTAPFSNSPITVAP